MSSHFGGDPFRDLARSTFDFYARFHVSPRLPEAVDHFAEEVGEFAEAVMKGSDKLHIAEEAADVLVTLLGASIAAGIEYEDLVQGMVAVAAKNDAKTLDTHEYRNGKIRRKQVGEGRSS